MVFFLLLFLVQIGLNLGLIFIAEKLQMIKWYELNRKKWMPKKCYFCLLFWISVIENILIFLIIVFPTFGWITESKIFDLVVYIIILFFYAVSAASWSYSQLNTSNENN